MTRFEDITQKTNTILATCDFYADKTYQCAGVLQCRPEWVGKPFMCGGAAPWIGTYSGTPEKGMSQFKLL